MICLQLWLLMRHLLSILPLCLSPVILLLDPESVAVVCPGDGWMGWIMGGNLLLNSRSRESIRVWVFPHKHHKHNSRSHSGNLCRSSYRRERADGTEGSHLTLPPFFHARLEVFVCFISRWKPSQGWWKEKVQLVMCRITSGFDSSVRVIVPAPHSVCRSIFSSSQPLRFGVMVAGASAAVNRYISVEMCVSLLVLGFYSPQLQC